VTVNLYEKLLSIVGADTLMVFGPSGSGKSTFAYMVALDALKLGRKVYFLDAERNLNLEKVPDGMVYYYTPEFSAILNFARNLPQADLYVLDSLGYPVLTQYAEASMDEKGRILLKTVALSQYLKIATYRYKALALTINQPVSSFGRTGVSAEELHPFGDKAVFGYKEVWRTSVVESREGETVCEIRSWRSRRWGRGKLLFKLRIHGGGVDVECFV
jgi:RecA/RadA recombinase